MSTPFTLARRAERMNPSIIREILKVTEEPGIVSLAGGLPSAETFPVEAMREACTRVLRDAPREALQYAIIRCGITMLGTLLLLSSPLVAG